MRFRNILKDSKRFRLNKTNSEKETPHESSAATKETLIEHTHSKHIASKNL